MKTFLPASLFIMLLAACQAPSVSPSPSESVLEREQRMEWWHDAKLGMFVHYGLYSSAQGEWKGKVYGGGVEWIQNYAGISADEYEKVMVPAFKPKEGFAEEWAQLAKEMGAQYLVFTTKHHEGFALHDSKLSRFDAKEATGRDLVKEISEATRSQGLKLGYYHSLWDWHHPDAYTSGGPHIKGSSDAGRDHAKYVDFLHAQVKELLRNYGKVDVLWWDYSSAQVNGEAWRAQELMAMCRKLQPGIIMNNRLYHENMGTDFKGFSAMDYTKGDFATPEQTIPATGMPGVNWESCMTLNGTWGFSAHDFQWKTGDTLVRNLVDCCSKGGNYLINLGPAPDGSIPEATKIRFRELGAWLRTYGESVYGTRANPLAAVPWGRITAKDRKLYCHIFDWPARTGPEGFHITVPLKEVPAGKLKAWMLADGRRQALHLELGPEGVVLRPDPVFQHPSDTVVVLETLD
ncbi:MAG: hypothetical protein RL095_2826 [Verrucomicrobiota bacterium]|jgi:alpha-L-fucosidase